MLWLGARAGRPAAYCAYLGLAGGDALAPFHAQDVWGRHFAGPYLGVWDGLQAAFEGARQLLSMQQAHVYFATGGESPFVAAGHNLLLLAFLAGGARRDGRRAAQAAARLRRLRDRRARAAAVLPGDARSR